MNTSNIIEIIKLNRLHPNKKLGQNFLCNNGILEKIVESSDINKNDNVLEIGPGLGGLTEYLIARANSVTAVEIDAGLFRLLKIKFSETENLNIIHADFLKSRIEGEFTKCVSNLPYYCSSEILFELALKYGINDVFVMLQKEMAERILSKPGSKSYGALTVTLGLYYDSKSLFNIDRKSFYPQPDVSSSFVHLKRHEIIDMDDTEKKLFHDIVKSAFWGRRKTLKRGLEDSPHLNLNREVILSTFKELNINANTRGEDLGVEEFKNITKSISDCLRNKI